MIEAHKLTKTFIKGEKHIEVLRGIDLAISEGESLAILGVSGVGKTTLLQILGLLDHPTSGKLIVDGADVFTWSEPQRAAFRNAHIGFVFQFHHLLSEFTSLENVMMPALINGFSRREAHRKAEITLTEVGLGDRLAHKPGELSGGEQQRVAIARAMIMEPRVILADEPTGNLDTRTGEKVQSILTELNESKGVTLIVVTHNKVLADRMSRTIYLKDGDIYVPPQTPDSP